MQAKPTSSFLQFLWRRTAVWTLLGAMVAALAGCGGGGGGSAATLSQEAGQPLDCEDVTQP